MFVKQLLASSGLCWFVDNLNGPELDQALVSVNQIVTLMKLFFPTNTNSLSLGSWRAAL